MPVAPALLLIGSAAVTGYGMHQQNKAAKSSAAQAVDTASYNAAVDLAEAKQIDMDAKANMDAARREAAVYTSRQQSAYVSSGVLNTGSALAVQAETAGRLEQQIQQERNNSRRAVSERVQAARLGVIYGDRQASAIKTQNRMNILNGGISILKTVTSAYQGGMFSGTGKNDSYAISARKGYMF